jgi:hypothetical protein
MVDSFIENLKYYRKLIPTGLKKDICEAIQMCNELKIELDRYREYFKNNNINIEKLKPTTETAATATTAETTSETTTTAITETIIETIAETTIATTATTETITATVIVDSGVVSMCE